MKTFFTATLLIAVGVGASMIADIFLKKSLFNDAKLLTYGIVFYALGALPVAAAFRLIDFGVVFIIWEAITVMAALVVAKMLFGEALTPQKLIAFALSLSALMLVYTK